MCVMSGMKMMEVIGEVVELESGGQRLGLSSEPSDLLLVMSAS